MIKKIIRVLFPSLFPRIQVTLGYLYDAYKFGKNNTGVSPFSNETKSLALIIRQTHGIEKGLAIDKMRYGFGEAQSFYNNFVYLSSACNIYFKKL